MKNDIILHKQIYNSFLSITKIIMNGFELNKIAGAIILAALIAMLVSLFTDAIYKPEQAAKRGYQVAVSESEGAASAPAAEEKPIDITALLATADVAAGQNYMKRCAACHDFSKGGPNKVGPELWGVVGANKGHVTSYSYSSALIAKGGVWDYNNLANFLHKPKKYIPGTKMAFAGIDDQKDIANVIVYLRTLSDSPIPLPK